jgi:hypothetical protein
MDILGQDRYQEKDETENDEDEYSSGSVSAPSEADEGNDEGCHQRQAYDQRRRVRD